MLRRGVGVLLVVAMSACDDGTGPSGPAPVARVDVAPGVASVPVGHTVQLAAVLRDEQDSVLEGRTVTWASSDPAVASVSNTGLVTAVTPGTATITATSESQTGSAAVTSKGFTSLLNGVDAEVPSLAAADEAYFSVAVPPGSGPLAVSVYGRLGVVVAGDPSLEVYTSTALDSRLCSAEVPGPDGCTIADPPGTVAVVVRAGGAAVAGYGVRVRHDGPFLLESIGSGQYWTCGLVSTGEAYCWGGIYSYTGLGDGTKRSYTAPAPVALGLRFTGLSVGGTYAVCGLDAAGAAYCWGTLPPTGSQFTWANLSPVAIAGGHRFTTVSVGTGHACGLTAEGKAFCWGGNSAGQLGDGTKDTTRVAPVAVVGGQTFTAISAGDSHTCAVAATAAAYCWGDNWYGALGNGTSGDRALSPTPVAGGLTFRSVVAGSQASCGITTSDSAYCWGSDYHGQLGIGRGSTDYWLITPVPSPEAVVGGHTFSILSLSRTWPGYACGVTPTGEAYCWGDNANQQLGDGSTEAFRTAPSAVAGGLTFATISTGTTHTCGLTPSGAAYCWGWGIYGALGNRTTESRPTPTMVLAR